MDNSHKITFGYDDSVSLADEGEDEDEFWPEGVPHNHAWNQSERDWSGSGVIDGLEGMMSITVSYFGCTEDQRNLINSCMIEFGSRARELFQQVIDEKSDAKPKLDSSKN